MRRINLLLTACILVLLVLCYQSVSAPMRFEKEKERREQVVKQHLTAIRTAEQHFCRLTGHYTERLDSLVRLGLLKDSLCLIPFAQGERFEVTTTVEVGRSGKEIPLMECGATYSSYLQGLDEASIADLTSRAGQAGIYPGLKIGDIATPNDNAGNWE